MSILIRTVWNNVKYGLIPIMSKPFPNFYLFMQRFVTAVFGASKKRLIRQQFLTYVNNCLENMFKNLLFATVS